MLNDLGNGATSGAAGTFALDLTSYLDMALRGRSSSDMPAKVAEALAEKTGFMQPPANGQKLDEPTKNRMAASGALMGYAVGLGIGSAYGLLRPHLRKVPWPILGMVAGVAAMAAADAPAVRFHLTDPRKWGSAGWLSDLIPHLAYGFVVAGVFESIHKKGAS